MHNAAMQIASQCPDNCCLPLLSKGKGFLSLEGGREDINHDPKPRAGWGESPFPFPFGRGPEGIITTCVGRSRSSPALPRSDDSSLSLCLCQTGKSPSPEGALRDSFTARSVQGTARLECFWGKNKPVWVFQGFRACRHWPEFKDIFDSFIFFPKAVQGKQPRWSQSR